MHKYLTFKASDGSVWGVPVEMIAMDRAKHYAKEFDGDVDRSLAEDTMPLFDGSDYEIIDWAANEMDFSDFDGHQVKLRDAPQLNLEADWWSCEKFELEG